MLGRIGVLSLFALSFIIRAGSFSYKTKIINTAILSFLPNLKQHHIILLKKDNKREKIIFNKESKITDVYIFDYTPKYQPDFLGYIKMFLGYKLPGTIRVVHLKKSNEKDIIDDWCNFINSNQNIDNAKTSESIKTLGDKKIVKILNDWDKSFNLYSNNCQHFSKNFTKSLQ